MSFTATKKFPATADEFLEIGERFYFDLQRIKNRVAVPDHGWYPYDSLSALQILTRLLEPVFEEVARSLTLGPVADIGCADGDIGLFMAQFGATVDLIDHLETNFNQMRGARILREELGLSSDVHDIDLDGVFCLPRPAYRFALFLGTLYHLRNPYYALETLASQADWCVLSTRIASVTPRRTRIEDEPVAYLLGAREANNDFTNYWIFSAAGLLRILDRAGWAVFGYERVGEFPNSDPVTKEADERMFVLLKSKRRNTALLVRPAYGWYVPESNEWRWTAKRFDLDVMLPADSPASEFALRVDIPSALFGVNERVRVNCSLEGEPAGSVTCTRPETAELRGKFQIPNANTSALIRLDFEVESGYVATGGDIRDLGVIIPLLGESQMNPHRIPLRIG